MAKEIKYGAEAPCGSGIRSRSVSRYRQSNPWTERKKRST